MKILIVTFPKEILEKIPEDERVLFILLGKLADELSIIQKLMRMSNVPHEDMNIRTAQNSQSFFLLTILSGKLYEGWGVLQREFFGKTMLSKIYDPLLKKEGRVGLDNIKKYFGNGKNLIEVTRNEFAFHFDSKKIREHFDVIPKDEPLKLYMAEERVNCFHQLSHIITSYALLKSIDSDEWKAIDKLMRETLEVANWFLDFIGELLTIILEKYTASKEVRAAEMDFPEPVCIDDVSIPYFIKRYR